MRFPFAYSTFFFFSAISKLIIKFSSPSCIKLRAIAILSKSYLLIRSVLRDWTQKFAIPISFSVPRVGKFTFLTPFPCRLSHKGIGIKICAQIASKCARGNQSLIESLYHHFAAAINVQRPNLSVFLHFQLSFSGCSFLYILISVSA